MDATTEALLTALFKAGEMYAELQRENEQLKARNLLLQKTVDSLQSELMELDDTVSEEPTEEAPPEPKSISAKDWVYGILNLPWVTRNRIANKYDLLDRSKHTDGVTAESVPDVFATAHEKGVLEDSYRDIVTALETWRK